MIYYDFQDSSIKLLSEMVSLKLSFCAESAL